MHERNCNSPTRANQENYELMAESCEYFEASWVRVWNFGSADSGGRLECQGMAQPATTAHGWNSEVPYFVLAQNAGLPYRDQVMLSIKHNAHLNRTEVRL